MARTYASVLYFRLCDLTRGTAWGEIEEPEMDLGWHDRSAVVLRLSVTARPKPNVYVGLARFADGGNWGGRLMYVNLGSRCYPLTSRVSSIQAIPQR